MTGKNHLPAVFSQHAPVPGCPAACSGCITERDAPMAGMARTVAMVLDPTVARKYVLSILASDWFLLLLIYSKNEQEDLTPDQLKLLRQTVEAEFK